MDNLESAIGDLQEEIAQLRATRAELDRTLEALEARWRMLEDKGPELHRHRCLHCGAYAVCPQAYGEDCPLKPTAPADCRDDPYRPEQSPEHQSGLTPKLIKPRKSGGFEWKRTRPIW